MNTEDHEDGPLRRRLQGRRAPIRVVVVDDDRRFAQCVASMLELDPRITVVAVATDGAGALRACRAHVPDVALVDLHMPMLDGIETTLRIRSAVPAVRVLMLTSDDDAAAVRAAAEAGVTRFLVKRLTLDAVRDAVVEAAALPAVQPSRGEGVTRAA